MMFSTRLLTLVDCFSSPSGGTLFLKQPLSTVMTRRFLFWIYRVISQDIASRYRWEKHQLWAQRVLASACVPMNMCLYKSYRSRTPFISAQKTELLFLFMKQPLQTASADSICHSALRPLHSGKSSTLDRGLVPFKLLTYLDNVYRRNRNLHLRALCEENTTTHK